MRARHRDALGLVGGICFILAGLMISPVLALTILGVELWLVVYLTAPDVPEGEEEGDDGS